MTYTDKKPTTPGWYWWTNGGHGVQVLEVYHAHGPDGARPLSVTYRYQGEYADPVNSTVDALDGQFAGPIPEPGLFSELAATAEVERAMGDEGTGSFADGIEYAIKVLSRQLDSM